MGASSMLLMVLSDFIQSLPSLIVDIVGLVLSLSNLGKKPRTARAGLIAFSGLIVIGLAGIVLTFMMSRVYSSTADIVRWSMVRTVAAFVLSLLGTACMGVIVYGMFAADKPKGRDAPSA